jgi:hypothetical protein
VEKDAGVVGCLRTDDNSPVASAKGRQRGEESFEVPRTYLGRSTTRGGGG